MLCVRKPPETSGFRSLGSARTVDRHVVASRWQGSAIRSDQPFRGRLAKYTGCQPLGRRASRGTWRLGAKRAKLGWTDVAGFGVLAVATVSFGPAIPSWRTGRASGSGRRAVSGRRLAAQARHRADGPNRRATPGQVPARDGLGSLLSPGAPGLPTHWRRSRRLRSSRAVLPK